MHRKIIKTICNCRFHLHRETMQYTWVLYSWDPHRVNQLELYLIQVPNTWQLPVLYAMIKPPVTLNSRNMIHSLVHLSREINLMKGARPRHTTCINLTQIKFCQKPLQSWLTVLPSSRVSSGRIILVFNHSKEIKIAWSNLNCSWRIKNVPTSNSWHFTNPKDSERILMVFWVYHHIRTWARRSYITFGPWRTMELLIMLWLVSVLPPRRWVRPLMPCSVATIPLRLLVALKVSKLSRTSQIGWEPGPLKDKEWHMVQKPCSNQARTPATPPSSTQAALNCPFPQMYLKR